MSIRSCLVSKPKNRLISNCEQSIDSTDLSPITFGVILSPKLRSKVLTNSKINTVTLDENKNYKAHTFKILLNSGASASIVRKDVLHEHYKMVGTFNTTFVTVDH